MAKKEADVMKELVRKFPEKTGQHDVKALETAREDLDAAIDNYQKNVDFLPTLEASLGVMTTAAERLSRAVRQVLLHVQWLS